MSAVIAKKTKKPTPLSTRALAAFLTWKQFDLLLLLREEPTTVAILSDELEEIKQYDVKHGGAFYGGTSWQSVYSCLRTMEARGLINRWEGQNGIYEWAIAERGVKAISWLEVNA
jgi:DNA-binding PadR family transcriptional regulator